MTHLSLARQVEVDQRVKRVNRVPKKVRCSGRQEFPELPRKIAMVATHLARSGGAVKTTRAAIEQRLSYHWQLEAFNALLLPATGVLTLWAGGERLGLAGAISMMATAVMLLIGATYWYAKLGLLSKKTKAYERTVKLLRNAKLPSGLLIVGSVALSAHSAVNPATSLTSRTVTVVFTATALLEFTNYYFVQLQHFDNAADFRRFMAGKGFRRAHLARAIARCRDSS